MSSAKGMNIRTHMLMGAVLYRKVNLRCPWVHDLTDEGAALVRARRFRGHGRPLLMCKCPRDDAISKLAKAGAASVRHGCRVM